MLSWKDPQFLLDSKFSFWVIFARKIIFNCVKIECSFNYLLKKYCQIQMYFRVKEKFKKKNEDFSCVVTIY